MARGQLTLFDMAKVVSSKNMWGCFSPEDLQQHRAVLADPGSSMQLLLNTLRKLDCYRLQPSDVSSSEIGRACATLAAYHPREEVSKLAGALVEKWRAQRGGEAFEELGRYDAAAAAAAPEGDAAEFKVAPPPPPPPPQPERVQPPRKERAQRLKEEEAFLDGSDFEAISESESEEEEDSEDDWQPGSRARKPGGKPGGGCIGKRARKY